MKALRLLHRWEMVGMKLEELKELEESLIDNRDFSPDFKEEVRREIERRERIQNFKVIRFRKNVSVEVELGEKGKRTFYLRNNDILTSVGLEDKEDDLDFYTEVENRLRTMLLGREIVSKGFDEEIDHWLETRLVKKDICKLVSEEKDFIMEDVVIEQHRYTKRDWQSLPRRFYFPFLDNMLSLLICELGDVELAMEITYEMNEKLYDCLNRDFLKEGENL